MLNNDSYINYYLKIHERSFVDEVIEIVRNIEKFDTILAVSVVGAPQQLKQKNIKHYTYLSKKMNDFLPKWLIPHYSGIWKQSCLDNNFYKFIDEIKKYKVVMIGLPHTKEFLYNSNIENYIHYSLNLKSSSVNNRFNVLNDLKNISLKTQEDKVYLFQCGELFSTWLIFNLNKILPENVFLIDIGRAIDIYCPNREIHGDENNVFLDFKNQLWLRMRR